MDLKKSRLLAVLSRPSSTDVVVRESRISSSRFIWTEVDESISSPKVSESSLSSVYERTSPLSSEEILFLTRRNQQAFIISLYACKH